jgi:hypothetical protein
MGSSQSCQTCQSPTRQLRCIWCNNLHSYLALRNIARAPASIQHGQFTLAHFFKIQNAFLDVVYDVVSDHIQAFSFEPSLYQVGWMMRTELKSWPRSLNANTDEKQIIFFPAGVRFLEGETVRSQVEIYVPPEIVDTLLPASTKFLANPSPSGYEQFIKDCFPIWEQQKKWIQQYEEEKRSKNLYGNV